MAKTIKKKKAEVIAPVEKKPKALLDRNKMAGGIFPLPLPTSLAYIRCTKVCPDRMLSAI